MKVTVKAFLIWRDQWGKPEFNFWPSDVSSTDPTYSFVKEMDIEVDIPDDFDPVPKQIETLKEKKQEILANAHVQAENIEEQIQRLLAIEFKP